ncbi:HECT domain-containing protein [Haematococcus lacustris]|uniref:HECT domain-containing protein n=1 Tax=Haematococcus lacustris TaxID=44745 RepID=A0A699YIK7_HAELA|nr:HECT domain-containing protein [Haematococcus lacustris]
MTSDNKVQVAAGENHSAALAVDGRLLCWGRGKYGALGQGDFSSCQLPAVVRSLQGVPLVQVACGGNHTLAMTASGAVYSWGAGGSGQLGLGAFDNTCRPNLVRGALADTRAVQVAAGLRHSLALAACNKVFVWGAGDQGQLGQGQGRTQAQPSPLALPPGALPDLPVLFIAAGQSQHTV